MLITRPRRASGVIVWTDELARFRMSIWAKPAPKRTDEGEREPANGGKGEKAEGKGERPGRQELAAEMEPAERGDEQGAAQRAEAANGLEEPVRRRVAVEDLDRPGRHEGRERQPEQADDSDKADDRPDHGMGQDVV